MPIRDFASTRVFLRTPLSEGMRVDLDRGQANYLVNVLRLGDGDTVLVFNGTDGEWRCRLASVGRKHWVLEIDTRTRPQPPMPDLHYLFAPLQQTRHDYMVQKAVEMGAGRLRPVLTRHGQLTRLNRDRVEANAIEAAEQCGILRVPTIMEPETLTKLLGTWDEKRLLIFADESAPHASPLESLKTCRPGPLAVLVGPEGGFERDERAALLEKPFVHPISLGPRLMRADTAAVAALALVNAALGDWQ